MIIHIFNGNQYHLSPHISLGYIKNFSSIVKPYIVILCNNSTDKEKYISLYNNLGFSDYCFMNSLTEFGKFVRKNAKMPFLFHGGVYQWFATAIFFGAKNLNWVCQGQGSSKGKSWKSKLFFPLKRSIYCRFKSIVTLMDEDKISLEKDYKIKPSIVSVIPYDLSKLSKYDALYDHLLETTTHEGRKPLVFLGNSAHNIKYYMEMLPRLHQYKGEISILCMNNYSLKRDETYKQLLQMGKELFGDDFVSDEEFYKFEDYIHYMNRCDIYVCSRETQTGLGAINRCMRLGKKVYIHGKNLSWMRNHYHVNVFDTDEINENLSIDDFTKQLTKEEKRSNSEAFKRGRLEHYDKWTDYLKNLDIDGIVKYDK